MNRSEAGASSAFPALSAPPLETVTGWDLSCRDWEQRLRDGRPLVPELPLFEDQAARGCRAFGNLRVPDIAGMPLQRDVCPHWFMAIVAALFGSLDPVTRRRMISEVFLLIPKKNAKSSNGGALMLTVVIMDDQPNQEYTLVAPTMQIANIAFKQATDTITADPVLKALLRPRTHVRQIVNLKTSTTLSIKAADADVITGGKQKGTLIDETHQFCLKPRIADLYTEIRGAMATRRDGFLIQLTTQSKDAPSPQFKLELEKARAVRDGKLDYPLLPVLYEFPDAMIANDEWRLEQNWGMVNPNLGRSVDREYLRREYAEAQRTGREHLMLFASQHLNVQIGLRLKSDAWAGADVWESAADPEITLEEIIERCEVCTVGIDGGGLDDPLALAVIGRDKVTREWLLWTRCWIHEKVLELRKEIAALLLDFARDGDMVISSSASARIAGLVHEVRTLIDAGLLPDKNAIGVDMVGIAQIVDALSAEGATADQIVGVSQGWKLNSAIQGMPLKLEDGTMRHAAQPMMDWMVGNAKAVQAGNAIRIDKQTSGSGKIDGLIAAFNAFHLMSLNPVVNAGTVTGADVFEVV